jgi:rhodanese-related sulfurtransferase
MTDNCLIRIDPETLAAWLAYGDTVLIDVREHTEYALEHIAGAYLMPLCRLDPSALPETQRIVLCCASGNRSQTAARRLGLAGLAHLEGGLTAWKAAGYSTVQKQPLRMSSMDRFQPSLQHA